MAPLATSLRNKVKEVKNRTLRKDDIARNLSKFRLKYGGSNLPKRPVDFEAKIEIVMPCYNHSSYLQQAFDSILTQTWHKYPITVTFINDNSSDNTEEVINKISKTNHKHINIKYLKNHTNLRQWASLNKAIEQSNNELIVILNDDDCLTEDCLEKIVTAFQKNDVYLVGGSSIWFTTDTPKHLTKPYSRISLTTYAPEDSTNFRALNDLNMTHSSTAFFKTAWKAVGGYRDKPQRISSEANEDRDFQMRLAALFPVAVFADYPLAFWRTDSSHGKDF